MTRRDSDRQYSLPFGDGSSPKTDGGVVSRKVVAFSDALDERERLEALRRLKSEKIFDTSRYDRLLK